MVSKQVDTRSLLQNIIRERFRERRMYRVRTLATSHIIILITGGAADIDPIILGRGRGRRRPFQRKVHFDFSLSCRGLQSYGLGNRKRRSESATLQLRNRKAMSRGFLYRVTRQVEAYISLT